jgi:hypothetical protein
MLNRVPALSLPPVGRTGAALTIAAVVLALCGCATAPAALTDHGKPAASANPNDSGKPATTAAAGATAGSNSAAASTAPGAGATAAAPPAGQPKPFAEVVKDAKEIPGLFRLWQKDDKVWIEIAPEQFDQIYFFQANLNQGIGENRIYGGMMAGYPFGPEQVVAFHKIGTTVQLLAKNVRYTAKAGTPEARAVAQAFSDSLLASTPVVSQPHPDRKSVLIEANALLLADIPGAASVLERIYRQSYSFDARNSSVARVRGTPEMVTFAVTAHYSLSRISLPPANPSPGAPPPTELPSTLPDVRSLFLGFHYSLASLPVEPMRPRVVDERLGYFWTERFDYTSDTPRLPIVRYANRWRLEKKDPAAVLSEPKQPIVYWLERSIPERYRPAIRDGILEWNKAFERIGFKDAIKVEIQPDDAEWDAGDVHRASVRWMTTARPTFAAIGPSTVDPRTGEILDADIGFDANAVRNIRHFRVERIVSDAFAAPVAAPNAMRCDYAEGAAQEAGFALDLFEARGTIAPDSPGADEFVNAFVKDVIMHEVGHTLGLTHNFRASTVYTNAQLADADFTERNGIAGSVMEYNPFNIALAGQRQGAYNMRTLGPYDYWAIEYGYAEFPPEREAEELERIASRSNQRELAFMMDDTIFASGLDPDVNMFDLGSDPLAYAANRLALVRELWARTERMPLRADEQYAILRRNLSRGLSEASTSVQHAAKFVGGITLLRDRAGSGRTPQDPVPATRQRAALRMLATEVFSADSFTFPPDLLRRASISYFDIANSREVGTAVPTPDIAIDQQVLALQRVALNHLMSDTVAQRLLNNQSKIMNPKDALRLAELYETLHGAIWSELKSRRDIPLFRRNLQREHATRLASALLRASASMPADARAQLRADATLLRAELAAAQMWKGYSPEARAHLAEALSMLDEALKAPIVRQGV